MSTNCCQTCFQLVPLIALIFANLIKHKGLTTNEHSRHSKILTNIFSIWIMASCDSLNILHSYTRNYGNSKNTSNKQLEIDSKKSSLLVIRKQCEHRKPDLFWIDFHEFQNHFHVAIQLKINRFWVSFQKFIPLHMIHPPKNTRNLLHTEKPQKNSKNPRFSAQFDRNSISLFQ